MKTDAIEDCMYIAKNEGYGKDVIDANLELAALKARIVELEAERTWQPIESAPKREGILVAIKRYRDLWQIEQVEEIKGCFYPIWETTRTFEPTHWMPLPPAPKED